MKRKRILYFCLGLAVAFLLGAQWKSLNNILLSGDLAFEGATADAFETKLTVTDPTADRTITFPDASGTMTYNAQASFDLGVSATTDGTLNIYDASSSNAVSLTYGDTERDLLVVADEILIDPGFTADPIIQFDGNTATGAFTYDDSEDLVKVTNMAIATPAACAITAAATVTADGCNIGDLSGTAATIDTINTCDSANDGRILYLLCGADATAVGDSSGNVQLSAAFSCTSEDTLTLICEGTGGSWLELARAVN